MKAAALVLIAGISPVVCTAAPITFTPQFAGPADDNGAWPLGGLRTFSVQIATPTDTAKRCGIDPQSLETGVRFILGQSGMKLVQPNAGPDGYIFVGFLVLNNCAVEMRLEVRSLTALLTNHRIDSSIIWQNIALLTGSDTGPRSEQFVEQMAKELVNDWNAANK